MNVSDNHFVCLKRWVLSLGHVHGSFSYNIKEN